MSSDRLSDIKHAVRDSEAEIERRLDDAIRGLQRAIEERFEKLENKIEETCSELRRLRRNYNSIKETVEEANISNTDNNLHDYMVTAAEAMADGEDDDAAYRAWEGPGKKNRGIKPPAYVEKNRPQRTRRLE